MGLVISVEKKQEGVFSIIPVGSIDSETYGEVDKAVKSVLGSQAKAIIFDFKGLIYITSMGLGTIFRTKAAIEKNGGTLAIINLQPEIKKVFDIVKVIPAYIFESMQEADEYLDTFLSKMQRGGKNDA